MSAAGTLRRRLATSAVAIAAGMVFSVMTATAGVTAPVPASQAPNQAVNQVPSRPASQPTGVPSNAGPSALGPTWALPAAVWAAWRQAFLDPSGRVVDTANGGISHSEGQGYGLLLAVYARDRATFDQIWTFTFTELLIRDDGLPAWKWVPNRKPHVADINNATDGDLLIAWALAEAGDLWHDPRYLDAARQMARAIWKVDVRTFDGRNVLIPGAVGFDHTATGGGMVVNPSYWVFEAFEKLAVIEPSLDWKSLEASGLDLVQRARFGSYQLTSDWVAMSSEGELSPAKGFEPLFGYNSLRIPLYLLAAGHADRERLGPIFQAWTRNGGDRPLIVDVDTSTIVAELSEPGYRIQTALLACALNDRPIPTDLRQFQPTSYFASTLHLLAMTTIARRYPQCL